MNKELQVVKAFYEFFAEKNPDIDEFKKMALKSLVYNGNIKLSTLEDFIREISVKAEIKKKENQIKVLKKEIKELNQKALETGSSLKDVDTVDFSEPAQSIGDGCSSSFTGTPIRGGC